MILPYDKIQPDYNVYYFRDGIYKVIRFNRKQVGNVDGYYRERNKDNLHKCDSSFSRARRIVLDLCLSNNFSQFFTGTLSAEKVNRFDLHAVYKKFSQFLRDQRKKYNSSIPYVIIPEQHKNGAWHFHGLLSLPDTALSSFDRYVPSKLLDRAFYNWKDYQKTFGYCALSDIRDPVACAFYITKYVSKDMCNRADDLGGHLYFASQGLNRSTLTGSFYGSNSELDHFITHDYEFVSTGFTRLNDNLDWTFGINADLENYCNYQCEDITEDLDFKVFEEMEALSYEQTNFL